MAENDPPEPDSPPSPPSPKQPHTLDYRPPEGSNRGAAIALWILTGLISIPAALVLFVTFAVLIGGGSYGQTTLLAAAILGAIVLIITVARKTQRPLSAALAALICVCALGLLAFGLCGSALRF